LTTFKVIAYECEDRWWVAESPSVPGCVSQGTSREEALENLKTALSDCLSVRAECGMPLTVEAEEPAVPGREIHRLEVEAPIPTPD